MAVGTAFAYRPFQIKSFGRMCDTCCMSRGYCFGRYWEITSERKEKIKQLWSLLMWYCQYNDCCRDSGFWGQFPLHNLLTVAKRHWSAFSVLHNSVLHLQAFNNIWSSGGGSLSPWKTAPYFSNPDVLGCQHCGKEGQRTGVMSSLGTWGTFWNSHVLQGLRLAASWSWVGWEVVKWAGKKNWSEKRCGIQATPPLSFASC